MIHLFRRQIITREARRLVRVIGVVGHLLTGLAVAYGIFPFVGRNDRRRSRLAQWWARRLCRLVGVRIQIEGEIAPPPALLVANHVSWLDIPCVLAAADATFVAKREVAAWPAIGPMAARAGTIFLSRGSRHGASTAADQMTWRLASRQSVVFFPEATTSDGSLVRPFYARLFQAAIRTRSPVQSVALRYFGLDGPSRVAPFIGDDDLLRHLWTLLGEEQIVAHLTFFTPRPSAADRRSFANHAHREISAAIAGFDVVASRESIRA